MSHVFTVDDDDSFRKLLKVGLEKAGYLVREARTAGEALELVPELVPDVVLLDFELPDASGSSVCRKLKARPDLGRTRVIMLTGRSEERIRRACFDAGADDFVAKPFSFRELILRIQAAIEPPGMRPTPRRAVRKYG